MSYIVNNSRGQIVAVVEDGTLNNSSISLALVGKNYTPYGESIAENTVYQLENFANNIPPPRPMTGQIWWNTSSLSMQVYNGTQWVALNGITVATEQPTIGVKIGDLWFNPTSNVMSVRTQVGSTDTWININTVSLATSPPSINVAGSLYFNSAGKQLYINDGTQWILVGPEGVPGFAVTKWTASTVLDIDQNLQPVIIGQVNGATIAIVSNTSFTIDPNAAPAGFSTVQKGITVASDAVFSGLATRATQLATARLINGVPFNGTADVSVPTAQSLLAGTNIVGSTFNGLSETTWSVPSYSTNQVNGIVSRDSAGDFAARTVTANLIGNVTGIATNVSGVVAPVNGGTGQSFYNNGEVMIGNTGDYRKGFVVGNSPVVTTFNNGNIEISYTGGTGVGNVTSVGITAGPGIVVSGGPITTDGNITVQNGGVISLTAGAGLAVDRNNGNVTISSTVQAFTRGMIMMWSGSLATIPEGWGLCDGTLGAPDLRDRFVVGSGGAYTTGAVGGSADAVVVSHSHSLSIDSGGAHAHSHVGVNELQQFTQGGAGWASGRQGLTSTAGLHSHSGVAATAGESGVGKNLPPYYALAFIMKL